VKALASAKSTMTGARRGHRLSKLVLHRANVLLKSASEVQPILLKKYTKIVYSELKQFPTPSELEIDQKNAFFSFSKQLAIILGNTTTCDGVTQKLDRLQTEVFSKLQANDMTKHLPPKQYEELREKLELEAFLKFRIFSRVSYDFATLLGYMSDTWREGVAESVASVVLLAYEADEARR